MKEYYIDHLQDDIYQVKQLVFHYDDEEFDVVFQGPLSECNAYIRLKDNENVDF